MSLLQPIFEQLNRERGSESSALLREGREAEAFPQGLRTSVLGCHAAWYRENLSHCSEPMLQYEWAWMNAHIDALEQFRCDALGHEGVHASGPRDAQLAAHLSESPLFLTLLLREFACRGLRPSPVKATVIPSEEAWEITSLQVKQEWGIV